jgi:hypothetical protein
VANTRPNLDGNPLDPIGFFFDVTGGLGDFIANGTPDSGSIPGVIQQRYRDHCDSWSRGELWVANVNPFDRAVLSSMCNPWLSSQGSGDPVLGTPDFISVAEEFSGQEFPDGLRINLSSAGTFPSCYRGYVVNFVNESQGFVNVTLEDCAGNFTTTNASNFEILDVGCCAGNNDPAPDPSPTIEPNPNPRPDPGLDPTDTPFQRPDTRTVTPMPPIDDPLGDPIQLPNFPLPDFGGGSTFPEPEPDPESDPGEPAPPVDIPAGDEAEDTAPEGQELVGVKVEFTDTPGQPRKVSNVIGPDLFVGGAYVFLGVDGQGLQLQGEGTVIESGQFFFAARPSDKWRVIAALGYSVRVTPYYREVNT